MTTNREAVEMMRRYTLKFNPDRSSSYRLAADLLEMHENKSLSLDNWVNAKAFVERYANHVLDDTEWVITENGA